MNFTDGRSSSKETKDSSPSTSTRVQVAARFRPVNETEANLPDAPVCEFGLNNSSVVIDDPTRNQSFHFSFDHILNDTTQNACYQQVASPLVDTVREQEDVFFLYMLLLISSSSVLIWLLALLFFHLTLVCFNQGLVGDQRSDYSLRANGQW